MLYAEYLERTHFTKEELIAMGRKTLVENAPEGGIPELPLPPFLMFDRITKVERGSRRGRIIAEQDITPDAWFFQCHFAHDPVQPGCLGLDALWQLLGFYCAVNGATGAGRALGAKEIDFFGQIRPYDKVVRYELDVRRFSVLKESGSAVAIANGTVLVDDVAVYTVKDAKVGIFRDIAYHDYPNPASRFARGGIMRTDEGGGA